MVSNRVRAIDASGIRRVFELGSSLRDPIDLSIGSPAFHASQKLQGAAITAIKDGRDRYTPTQGIAELRDHLRKKYSIAESDFRDVFVSSGVSGGIFMALCSLMDAGDEVLIPDPYFCIYRDLAQLTGIQVSYYDTYPNFTLDPDRTFQNITDKTKAIIVNSPANPTGIAISQDILDEIVRRADEKGIWVIYDEIYENFCYDSKPATIPKDFEKAVVLNGASKSGGIPGWRMGYVCAPKSLCEEMLKVQQYSFVCAPSVSQYALASCFEELPEAIFNEYKEKRDFLYAELVDKFSFIKPGGAFYAFLEAPGGGQEFMEKCLKSSLLVVPGHVFSRQDTHIRVSFSASWEKLMQGVEVLKSLCL